MLRRLVDLLLVGAIVCGMLLFVGTVATVNGATPVESDEYQTIYISHTVYLPLVFRTYEVHTPTAFGVQLYGGLSDARVSYSLLQESRSHWVRWPLYWRTVEPVNVDPSAYNWTTYDRDLSSMPSDIHIIATISYNPDWAATYANGPINKVPIGEFVSFVSALVERYDGDGFNDAPGSPVVRDWEFYNEPDSANRWAAEQGYGAYWGNYGDLYADMLCAVYPVVKSASSEARVIFGGVAYDSFVDQGGSFVREFIDVVFQHGGGDCFDVMNFHYYPAFTGWDQYGNGLTGKTNYLHSKLQSYGVVKPFMVTEAGWHSNDITGFPSTPEIQSRYVVQIFAQGLSVDLESLIWWTWVDPGLPYGENGLLTADFVKKPSFSAYRYAAGKLGTAQAIEEWPWPGGDAVEAYYVLSRSGNPLYVLWSENELAWNVRLPLSKVSVTDMYGNVVGVVGDGDDGLFDNHIVVRVTSNPVYVEHSP